MTLAEKLQGGQTGTLAGKLSATPIQTQPQVRTGSAGQSLGTDHGSIASNIWANLAATPAAVVGAGKALVNTLTSSEQGAGGEIASGGVPSLTGEDTLNKANQGNAASDVAYIQAINELKKSGKPVTESQQKIYDHISQNSSSVGTQKDLLPHAEDTNTDALVNTAGVALDALGGGTFTKEGLVGKDALKTGLERATPTVIDAAKSGVNTVKSALTTTAEQQAIKDTAKVVEAVSPKLTSKETAEALATRGGTKSGILGTIKLNVDPSVQRIADTVKQFVPDFNASKSLVENINATKESVGALADTLKQSVINSGKDRIYSFKELGSTLRSLEKNPQLVGDIDATYNKVIDKALEIARNNGGKISDLFQSRKEFDSYISRAFPDLYSSEKLTPMRSAIKDIRNAMTDFTAEHLPDIGLRESLTHQSRLLDAIENMSEKAAGGAEKEVGTNKLQRIGSAIKNHPVASGFGGMAAYQAAKQLPVVGQLLP